MRMPCARLMAGALLIVLAGCGGTMQTRAILEATPASLPVRIELDDVPFFPQDDFQCGPAALAMVFGQAEIQADPEALRPEVYLPERQGSLQAEMLATARRHGLVAYRLAPQMSEVLEELAAGTPVIVLLNLGLDWYPVWHYAVMVGYDLYRAEIILHSGRERRQAISMRTFEHTWARSGYWAMLAMAPHRIPRTADEDRYVAAISALESVGQHGQSRIAYLAAAQRWPHNLAARLGAGNAAYRMKDMASAEEDFRVVIAANPDSVAALNNLAQVLSDQGRDEEALNYAQQAVDLGGAFQQTAQETLADIQQKLRLSSNRKH